MPNITTQSDFRDAQRALIRPNPEVRRRRGFCYLCGNALPDLGVVGRKKLVHDEHIIPRAVCGETPDRDQERWRLTAEVHLDCDKQLKRNFDEVYQGFQHTLGNDPDLWSENQARHIVRNLGGLHMLQDGQVVGTIGGVDNVVEAVWCWVRGLHALLHSVCLPPSSPRQLIPPVSSFLQGDKRSLEEQDAELKSFRSTFAQLVILGSRLGKANTIRCWGGSVQFHSIWSSFNSRNNGRRGRLYDCFWVLSVPGLEEMTARMMGEYIPWVGMYSAMAIPLGAGYLSRADLYENNKLLESIQLPSDLNQVFE